MPSDTVRTSPRSPGTETASHSRAPHDPGGFEKRRAGVWQTAPQGGFAGCLLMTGRVHEFGGKSPEGRRPPSCQGCCRSCDPALRLTLTPRPRLCWPRILQVRLLSPSLCALCGEAAGHRPQPCREAGTLPGGQRVPVSHWGLCLVCLFPGLGVSKLSLAG